MNPELLACPFCGSDNCRIAEGAVGLWRVECMNGPCLVSGPLVYGLDKAIQAWNRRVPSSSTAQRPFTCFKCGDGNTPLYCLNCARDGWKPEAAQPSQWEVQQAMAERWNFR